MESSGSELLATAISTIVLALVLVVANAAGADGVGFRDVVVEVEGEEAVHALWYPASGPSERVAVGPFTMSATRKLRLDREDPRRSRGPERQHRLRSPPTNDEGEPAHRLLEDRFRNARIAQVGRPVRPPEPSQ